MTTLTMTSTIRLHERAKYNHKQAGFIVLGNLFHMVKSSILFPWS